MGTNLNQTGKSKPSKQTSSTMNENYVRSYTCDFCKKGFSNAQALGGHMNIHRRDRAKLRQSSMDNNDNDMQSGGNLSVILDDQCSTQSQQSTSTSQNQTVTGSTTTENIEGGVSVTHELPLFVDGHVTSVGGSSGTLSRLRRDELLSLDLELRLGSKPQNKHPT